MQTRLPSLFALLLLSGLLLAAGGAHGASAGTPADEVAFEEAFEGESEEAGEGEEEQGQCETAEEEVEADELGQNDADEICEEEAEEGRKKTSGPGKTAEDCVLRSAHANAAVNDRSNKLKLTLGYTTYEPASATIEIGKGANHVATLHRHLGRSGVLRIIDTVRSQHLKRLVVQIKLPSARSAGCPFRRLVLFPR
jgi:hypothetical protein